MASLDPKDPVTWTLGGGAVVALWKFIRMIRGDISNDGLDKRKDKLLEERSEEIRVLKERCDKFAAERNDAQNRAIKAETERDHLRAQIEDADDDRLADIRSFVARCEQDGLPCGAHKLMQSLLPKRGVSVNMCAPEPVYHRRAPDNPAKTQEDDDGLA